MSRLDSENRPDLYGLILAGGASSRMREDKALLDYHGKPQLLWTYELVRACCDRVFVSVRADQADEPVRSRLPQIVDQAKGLGPAGGILSAQARYPDVAWLVVACDLPFLQETTLHRLIASRDQARDATAYTSSHDGLPEPLCAIWEPRSHEPLKQAIAAGRKCPRKVLINADTKLIEQPHPAALDNVNTPEERREARAQCAVAMKTS